MSEKSRGRSNHPRERTANQPKTKKRSATRSGNRAGKGQTREPSTKPGNTRGNTRDSEPTTRPRKRASGQRNERSANVRARNDRPLRTGSSAPKARRPRRAPRRVRLADPRKRLRISLIGLAVLLSLVGGRLVQLQGLDASAYAEAASGDRVRTTAVPAERGEIQDRDGQVLAANVEAYDVVVDQTMVENPAAYALQLAPLLGVPEAELQQKLTGEDRFVYLEKGVPGTAWRQVRELDLPGVNAESNPQRDYPAGTVAGSLLGFVGADGHGLAGMEMSRDEALAGTDGSLSYQMGVGGKQIPLGASSGSEASPGQGLRLTIDRDLQWYTQQAVAEQVEQASADAGVATVLNTETGEIEALVSVPTVDPNEPGKTEAAERRNRAVEDAYEPGSVFKPLTAAAVLDAGEATPETLFTVPDQIQRDGARIGDYYNHPEQEMTLAGIIAKSSNVGTLLAAETLAKEDYRNYLSQFGIGTPTQLGLPGETSGHLGTDMSDLTRDNVSFGQGVSVSVVQLAAAYATIANDGVRVQPRIVDARLSPDGGEEMVQSEETERVVSEEAANGVTDMMEAVMSPEGTGEPATVEGYRVAGKTGTAQRVNPSTGEYSQYNASFMGFAPAEDPKYVVAVSLFNTRNGNSGGALAGPAFAEIMQFALQARGVPPSTESPPELPFFADDTNAG